MIDFEDPDIETFDVFNLKFELKYNLTIKNLALTAIYRK